MYIFCKYCLFLQNNYEECFVFFYMEPDDDDPNPTNKKKDNLNDFTPKLVATYKIHT